MMKTLKQVGELKFIQMIAGLCQTKPNVKKGIGDDAAVVEFSPDKFLLFTSDMLIEGVHFKRNHLPQGIGHKAMASSISDIAAMAGIPQYALVSLGLPKELSFSFAKKIYQGLVRTARQFDIQIIGGDTNEATKIIIDVFLTGVVEKRNLVLRSGAKKGDLIFVTGRLGGSLFGKHLRFTPRLKEARFLVKNYKLNSMIDISDGLIQDLNHILKESKAGAILYEARIPLSKKAKSAENAYNDGEDFELLFTLPKKEAGRLISKWPFKNKVPLSFVGEIMDKEFGFKIKDKSGKIKKIKLAGFQHFR